MQEIEGAQALTGYQDSSFSTCPWFWWCVRWLMRLFHMAKHQREMHHHVYCENTKLHIQDNQKSSWLFLKSDNDSDCAGPSERIGDTEHAEASQHSSFKKFVEKLACMVKISKKGTTMSSVETWNFTYWMDDQNCLTNREGSRVSHHPWNGTRITEWVIRPM